MVSSHARGRAAAVTAAVVVLAPLAGCSGGGGSGGSAKDPQALLAAARQQLLDTSSVHFVLTSEGVPSGGTTLSAGEGDAARPDRFRGEFTVSVNGLQAKVKVVSVGGTVYAQLPLAAGYTKVDPATFQLNDPGRLLRADGGLPDLLTRATSVRDAGKDRFDGTVLREVDIALPGSAVDAVLTDADPSVEVTGTVGIDPDTERVRRAVLRGPFFAKGTTSTFTIVLDRYGEQVDISAPPTG